MTPRDTDHQAAGFTLVELAVVVVIMGTMAVAGTAAWTAWREHNRHGETVQKLRAVEDALTFFTAKQERLPCPDRSSPPDGLEDCAVVSGAAERGVPYGDLGLGAGDVTDGWGEPLYYVAGSGTANNALPCPGGLSATADISVQDSVTLGATYVLLSGGGDKTRDSFSGDGDAADTFRARQRDDVIRWRSPTKILVDGGCRMARVDPEILAPAGGGTCSGSVPACGKKDSQDQCEKNPNCTWTPNEDGGGDSGTPGAGCKSTSSTSGKSGADGAAKPGECIDPHGDWGTGQWANIYDSSSFDQSVNTNLYAYFDFTRAGSPGGNRPKIVTDVGKQNNNQNYSYEMQADLSRGNPCYTTTPAGLEPIRSTLTMSYADKRWRWYTASLTSASNGYAVDFMGTTQGGSGCNPFVDPVIFSFNRQPQNLKTLFATIVFDPDFGDGPITQPQAVGILFRKDGVDLGVVYRCYADQWASSDGVVGADTIFPQLLDPYGFPVNFCTGKRASEDNSVGQNGGNPDFARIYLYGGDAPDDDFDEVEFFPVGDTRFWVGGIGLGIN